MSENGVGLDDSREAVAASRLRSDRVFRQYWTAHTTSSAGSAVTVVVLPILMFQRTGSAFLTASLGAAYIAPYVVLGSVIGSLADHLEHRRVMVGCDLASAAVLGSIPLASALGVLSTAHLFVATVLAGVLLVGFDAAQFGALPQLFGRDRLVVAMSSIGAIDTVLAIMGTAVGGVLATTLGAPAAIWIDAASFLASAALLWRIRRPFGGPAAGHALDWAQLRADIAEGARFLFGHRVLRSLTLAGSAAALTGGAVTGLLVVYAVRQLALTDHDPRLGVLYSAGALGTLAATIGLPRLTRRYALAPLNLVTRTASLAFVVVLAMLRDFVAALIVYAAFSAAESLAIRSAIVFRQLVTPDHLQGRVNVLGRMTALSGQPLGAALGGAVAEAFNVRVALLLLSTGLVASTVAGWVSPGRRRWPARRHDRGADGRGREMCGHHRAVHPARRTPATCRRVPRFLRRRRRPGG